MKLMISDRANTDWKLKRQYFARILILLHEQMQNETSGKSCKQAGFPYLVELNYLTYRSCTFQYFPLQYLMLSRQATQRKMDLPYVFDASGSPTQQNPR